MYNLELNGNYTNFNKALPEIRRISNNCYFIRNVFIYNDFINPCKSEVIKACIAYLENHGLVVTLK